MWVVPRNCTQANSIPLCNQAKRTGKSPKAIFHDSQCITLCMLYKQREKMKSILSCTNECPYSFKTFRRSTVNASLVFPLKFLLIMQQTLKFYQKETFTKYLEESGFPELHILSLVVHWPPVGRHPIRNFHFRNLILLSSRFATKRSRIILKVLVNTNKLKQFSFISVSGKTCEQPQHWFLCPNLS